ncbi:MAG: hypothetical protein ABI056_02440 [Caulobacteraceae bacterium]
MTQIHWLNDVSGDFGNAADWSGGTVPGPTADVSLGALGGIPYTVTVSSDQHIFRAGAGAHGFVAAAAGVGAGPAYMPREVAFLVPTTPSLARPLA